MCYLGFTLRRSHGWRERLQPFSRGRTGGPRKHCRTSFRITAIANSFLLFKEGNCFIIFESIYFLSIKNLSFELNLV